MSSPGRAAPRIETERATDWRGNNNIAESIFLQMALAPHPGPKWIVCGAGTGGTSATIGRYVRYRCFDTRHLDVGFIPRHFFPAELASLRMCWRSPPARIQ